MLATLLPLSVALLPFASAHFRLNYPPWRGDSFATGASQWIYPCANVSQDASNNNRTLWPLDGGSVIFAGSHPHALTTVNLALGEVGNSFNVSIIPLFNQTGNGTFCVPKVGTGALKGLAGVTEGAKASIQVIQISTSGAALYNCADITFSSQAKILEGDQCKNATGVSGVDIENVGSSKSSSANGSSSSSAPSSTATAKSDAVSGRMAWGVLVGAVAVGMAAAM
ncbi:hypothetical protein EJ06DRAFT_533604 [Trichodelitschia bisporula]|uniref:Copper acquisition factor BIM1-like domain-containing protein n=1 Tax=Trichodelitschia bisporula TaxID=703511 RepID=A0A6G1HLK7_9PEZI|nr:hypothetical protein EJ06DRAFT_533604 [Trichodelitschia bisporula]